MNKLEHNNGTFVPLIDRLSACSSVYDNPTSAVPEVAEALEKGIEYHQMREFEKAVPFFEQAVIGYGKLGDRTGEGHALVGLGSALYALGQYDDVIDVSKKGILVAREIRDRSIEKKVLDNLGNTYRHLRNY
ncbi:MAG: tetratricopeptide repeat protein, partial [Merismopedia sp. SIO2A8]|nr:tetratricopeptide repeat protein [Merismopedia sp. SIO2A8]